jgi:hypothetical protein
MVMNLPGLRTPRREARERRGWFERRSPTQVPVALDNYPWLGVMWRDLEHPISQLERGSRWYATADLVAEESHGRAVELLGPLAAFEVDGRPVEADVVPALSWYGHRLVHIAAGTELQVQYSDGWLDYSYGYDGSGIRFALPDGGACVLATAERVYEQTWHPSPAQWACALTIVPADHPLARDPKGAAAILSALAEAVEQWAARS